VGTEASKFQNFVKFAFFASQGRQYIPIKVKILWKSMSQFYSDVKGWILVILPVFSDSAMLRIFRFCLKFAPNTSILNEKVDALNVDFLQRCAQMSWASLSRRPLWLVRTEIIPAACRASSEPCDMAVILPYTGVTSAMTYAVFVCVRKLQCTSNCCHFSC